MREAVVAERAVDTPPTITRTPRWSDDAKLGGPDRPGGEFVVRVNDIPVGATYWCPGRPKGEHWASWGTGGLSLGHRSRGDAEAVQVRGYLDLVHKRHGDPGRYRVEVKLPLGPSFLVEVEAQTYQHARELSEARWPAADSVRVIEPEDDVRSLMRATETEVTAVLERWGSPWASSVTAGDGAGRHPAGGESRTCVVLEDPLGPNAAAVVSVAKCATVERWGETLALLRAANMDTRDQCSPSRLSEVDLEVSRAARAAGVGRWCDLAVLKRTLGKMRLAILLQDGWEPDDGESALGWETAWKILVGVATVYLVADRDELSDEVYTAATELWRRAVPGALKPDR